MRVLKNAHLIIGLIALLGTLVPAAIATNACRKVAPADQTAESPCNGSGVLIGCAAYVACPKSDECVPSEGGYQACKVQLTVQLPCRFMIGGNPDPSRPGCCYNGIELGETGTLVYVDYLEPSGNLCSGSSTPGLPGLPQSDDQINP